MAQLEIDLPGGYAEGLSSVKEQVPSAQHHAQRVVKTAMIELYWGIGRTIIARQAAAPWGSKVLQRLAADLRSEFPHMKGFSLSSLKYMRSFAAVWDGPGPIGQQAVGQLPWGHITVLLDKLDSHQARDWYAAKAVQNGWSRAVLEHHILTRLYTRTGAAPNNFEARLPGEGTDLAREVANDPLVLDFLRLTEEADERAMEEAMTLRMSQTLAEFGPGFAFVGRQYRLSLSADADILGRHSVSAVNGLRRRGAQARQVQARAPRPAELLRRCGGRYGPAGVPRTDGGHPGVRVEERPRGPGTRSNPPPSPWRCPHSPTTPSRPMRRPHFRPRQPSPRRSSRALSSPANSAAGQGR